MTLGLEPPFPRPDDRALRPVGSISAWTDTVWQFDDGGPGQRLNRRQLPWDFRMPDGTRFDDPRWAGWLHAAKLFVWSLYADPPQQRRVPRMGTVRQSYKVMRVLIAWMVNHEFDALTELGRDAQRRFISDMAERKGREGERLRPTTLVMYQNTLQLLYFQGLKYRELAIEEPSPADALKLRRSDQRRLPYTPDEIAVPLVLGAMRLVGPPATDVMALQARAESAFEARLAEGRKKSTAQQAAFDAIAGFRFETLPGDDEPWYPDPITTTRQIRYLVDRVEDACFVLLSYMVGMRASEILTLEAGCLEREPSRDGTEDFIFIKGRIFKTAPTARGTPHRWVAPEIIIRVVEVLEKLSESLRRVSGKSSLWLNCYRGVLPRPNSRIVNLTSDTIAERLNTTFVPFIDLPAYQGEPWHLSTHQGRKTFARFVAKQDRNNLHALKEQLGHRSVVMTDQAYAGVDYEISELINETTQEEMVQSLAEALTAERLGGAAGRRMAERSPFRGQTTEQGARDYALARLTDPNFTFSACEYGNCYYRQEHSACRGDVRGPNPVLRTPSACVLCKNFIVQPKHRPWWEERRETYADFLANSDFAPHLRNDIEQKIAECDTVLAQLGASGSAVETQSDC